MEASAARSVRRPVGVEREAYRAAVVDLPGPHEEPAIDECVDHRRHARLREREAPGERGRPLVPVADHREEAVLRQREIAARALEQAGDPGEGADGELGRRHSGRIPNS